MKNSNLRKYYFFAIIKKLPLKSRKKDMERKKNDEKTRKKTSIPPQIFQCIRHRGLSIDPSQFDNFRFPFLIWRFFFLFSLPVFSQIINITYYRLDKSVNLKSERGQKKIRQIVRMENCFLLITLAISVYYYYFWWSISIMMFYYYSLLSP